MDNLNECLALIEPTYVMGVAWYGRVRPGMQGDRVKINYNQYNFVDKIVDLLFV